MQLRPVEHKHTAIGGRPAGVELALPLADRPAGLLVNLQRPDEPPCVVRVESGGRDGVGASYLSVEPFGAVLPRLVGKSASQFPVGRRPLEDAAQQALQVQRRAADEQRLATSVGDFGGAAAGRLDVLGQTVLFMRFEHVDQMMRHGATLLGRGLGRADVHPPIQGHGIQRENLGVDALRKLDRHGRFGRRRRTGKKPTVH